MATRKLLLADDSITIQKVVNLTFTEQGIDVTAVGNGSLALEQLGEVKPDLVLADVHMPSLSGYELCELIKQDSEFGHTPVILLVGSFEPFDEAEAKRVGADDYVTKPFQSIKQLVSKVTALLDAKPIERSQSELSKEKSKSDASETLVSTENGEQAVGSVDSAARSAEAAEFDEAERTFGAPDENDAIAAGDAPEKAFVFAEQSDNMTADDAAALSMNAESDAMELNSDTPFEERTTAPLTFTEIQNFSEPDAADIENETNGWAVVESDFDETLEFTVPSAAEEMTVETAVVEFSMPDTTDEDALSLESQDLFVVPEADEMPLGNTEFNVPDASTPAAFGAQPAEVEFDFVMTGEGTPSNNAATLDLGDLQALLRELEDDDSILDLFDDEPATTGAAAAQSENIIQFNQLFDLMTPEMAVAAPAAEAATPTGEPIHLAPAVIEAIAQKVVEKLSDRIIREIAWDVVPQLSELLIRKQIEGEESK